MASASTFQIHLSGHSLTGEDHAHSLLITLLRGLAALQVAAAHLRAEMFPSLRTLDDPTLAYQLLAFSTGFAHQAVLVFFLISGWLVGGSLLDKQGQPQALASYAIDRISRLWTVMIPAFGLMLLIGLFIGELRPGGVDFARTNDFSATVLLGNLVGLQTVTLPQFGGNYALWSLANETWYYLMFPLLLAGVRGKLAQRLLSSAALLVICLSLPLAMVLYFLTWLLGAAFSRVRIDCGAPLRWAVLALLATVSVYFRFTGSNDDMVVGSFAQDIACSLVFLPLLASLQFRLRPGPALARVHRAAKALADLSFTLYVLHVPLIALLRYLARTLFGADRLSPDAPLHFAIYFGMLGLILGAAWLSWRAFESRTPAVRRRLKDWLLRARRQPLRQT
jgi:peptidoglycan/LPS O-acetylase OafA/YrhL